MPSADDLFNQLKDANTRLEAIKGHLVDLKAGTDAVKNAVNETNATLTTGFDALVTIGTYTNLALSQNAKQNDTIICILEHISKNTCGILNEAVVQARLQKRMEEDLDSLEFLYATEHGSAALEQKRLAELRRQVEECCPPPEVDAACKYQPCAAPRPLGDPPKDGGVILERSRHGKRENRAG